MKIYKKRDKCDIRVIIIDNTLRYRYVFARERNQLLYLKASCLSVFTLSF